MDHRPGYWQQWRWSDDKGVTMFDAFILRYKRGVVLPQTHLLLCFEHCAEFFIS
jgi:hypothetical protein